MKVIVYKTSDGVAVITPSNDSDIDFIAKKDVPMGLPYKIMDSADLPDYTFREAWAIEDSALTDGEGADFGVGSLNAVIGYTESGLFVANVVGVDMSSKDTIIDYSTVREVNL